MNHAPAETRAPALRRWAAEQSPQENVSWLELAAASSSSLGLLALLAIAADPSTRESTVEQVRRAYFPWIDALTTLLDSVVDGAQDAKTGELNFVGEYASAAVATRRLHEITKRAVETARELPHGERHVVVVAGMIALHLSHLSAWMPTVQPTTRAVLRASNTMVAPLLLMILATWRATRVFSTE
jgi:tetraprenyl-beta-curcumene synthase